MLLRGETMRSGRRHSKINRRNLHRDREISLTMRALVRAKWPEMGGGEVGCISEVGKKEMNYMPMQLRPTIKKKTEKEKQNRLCSLIPVFPRPSFKSEMDTEMGRGRNR